MCAAGGVFNILLMMGGNLVGFVLGMDGAQYFAHLACSCLFVGVQLMFEYRYVGLFMIADWPVLILGD